MSNDYDESQKLITKINVGLREIQNSNSDNTVAIEKTINKYKQSLYSEPNQSKKERIKFIGYKMTDEHQSLVNRFNSIKADIEAKASAEHARNELFGNSSGGGGARNRQNAAAGNRQYNHSEFLDRSEIEIDGFIGTGLAALENLKQQRAYLNVQKHFNTY
ncbi:hypothetical protein AYI69_g7014 [Smittium culicis]|uniref:Uncharacterized protein n=1 Tax=Smittium culicis TaxID=133412 RepID=A0A1R1XUY9_9FUNG|nr:hypothetical protein AYI69_g7014 [Smittium culicis]